MNKHIFVPLGYPKWITDIPMRRQREMLMGVFHELMEDLQFVSCGRIDKKIYESTFEFKFERLSKSTAIRLLNTWMTRLLDDSIPLLQVSFSSTSGMENVFVTGRFFESALPRWTNLSEDGGAKVVFRTKVSTRIKPEHVFYMYQQLRCSSCVKVVDTRNFVDIDDHAEKEHPIPQTAQVRIVYTRQGGRIGIHATRIVEGSFVIPGVTSASNGMVMDVEARRLKSGDTFWLVEGEKDEWSGMVTVDHLEEV